MTVAPTMTSRQLVANTLAGRSASRPVAGPLAVHYCARIAGRTIREYTSNATTLSDSVLAYYDRFRPDAVWLSADTWVTAQAMGAAVGGRGDDQPFGAVGPPLVQRPGDIDRIPPPDPGSQGRWPLMLDAAQRLRAGLGNDVFSVACFDQYPFSLACALMGIDRLMMALVDDRPMVEALLERCLGYTVAYGAALGRQGADMLSGGDSPAVLIGPRAYREVAAGVERRAIEAIRAATGNPVSLHICGNATPLLADMVATGADVLELDWQVDLADACRRVGPNVALWGNLDPVRLLARGTPSDVAKAARRALEAVSHVGHRRFVLSSGCTLAMETPVENIEAILAVCQQ